MSGAPNSSAPISSPSGLVLITGLTGFVGSTLALHWAERGNPVRGTARSQEKADAWLALHPEMKGEVEFMIVGDVTDEEAMRRAMEGAEIVMHTASPFHFKAETPDDYLIPAVTGTASVLNAVIATPTVKHVVVTSSFAAVADLMKGDAVGKVYTDDDWNPADSSLCASVPNPAIWYCASKALAEKKAWEIWNAKGEGRFTLTTLLPPMVFGPPEQVVGGMGELNQSSMDIWNLLNGANAAEVPPTPFPVMVDVRDVARAHILAIERAEVADGQRYLLIPHHYSSSQHASLLGAAFPTRLSSGLIPKSDNTPPHAHYGTDSSKAERDLGMVWTPMAVTVKDAGMRMVEMEERLESS